MAARSASISSKCTGVIRDRCEGTGVETPELPGPLLREGKVEAGLVPTSRRPGPGSSADASNCSSTCSPSLCAPACQTGPCPQLLQPRGARASLGPWLRGRRHRLQGEDTGPWPQGGRGSVVAPCTRSPPCPAPLSLHLAAGGRPLGLQTLPGPRQCGRADPGLEVRPRSAKLGPPGVRRERWVCRCEGVSALGMRAGDGGIQLGDPVRWPPAMSAQMGLPALS